MSVSKKVEEAQEHIRQAEKSLKIGLLKWRPDFDIAADEYQKAATCYRVCKKFDECKQFLMKAADCYKENRSLFHAARCFEQIILTLKDQGKLDEIEDLAHRACTMYQQQGSPEAGVSALDKAAKMIEGQLPLQALNLYQHAIGVVMIEDSSGRGAEYLSRMARILIRLERYDEAADSIRREITIHQENENIPAIGRLTVALVLVQLARGDSVAAEKAYKEWGNCCDPAEMHTLEILIQAYDDEDKETAQRALSSSFIKHMDVEYARLARIIRLPEGIQSTVPKLTVVTNAQQAYTSPSPEEIEKRKAEAIAAGNWPSEPLEKSGSQIGSQVEGQSSSQPDFKSDSQSGTSETVSSPTEGDEEDEDNLR